MAAAGFTAAALPVYLFLRREMRKASPVIQKQGWPIQLMQVMYARYVERWIEVQGLENLPTGSYLIAANHPYKSGVDGFILGHLLATQAGRVPRIVVTSDTRNLIVQAERWVLQHYGIALLVGSDRKRSGTSDIIAGYLRAAQDRAVMIFPAGRAVADPATQLANWSTGTVVAAYKSGCPVVPVAIGGLRLDWTPETVIFAGMEATEEGEPPFRMSVRIGQPLWPTMDHAADLERLRGAVKDLMQQIPGLRPAPGEDDPRFGKITLRDGRTLAYCDRGPKGGTPVLYFHSFQGSRLETWPDADRMLERLHIRLIAPDRPGIGLSTPLRERTLDSWAEDVRELAAKVVGEGSGYSILGFSGGATYALACAHLPGVKAVYLTGGLGLPHLFSTWRRYSAETWMILLSAKLATVREAAFLRLEEKHHRQLFHAWEKYIDDVREGLNRDDLSLLAKPEVEELFRQNRREGYAQGPGYLLQEVQALYSDPEVNLTEPGTATVRIIHGTEDRVVPAEVARDLNQQIPGSTLRELEGRGHYFLYDPAVAEEILRELKLDDARSG